VKLPTQMVPLIGFAPDMPPFTPGVITDCANVVPTNNGFAAARSLVAQMPALSAECRGAAVTADISGTRRLYAGTGTQLYVQDGSTWATVSRGGGYTDGGDNLWSFAQFGNATVASNGLDTLQANISGGAFADISGAPKAKVVVASADFVLAFNTNDATYGAQGDRWWCSAFRAHTDWTPSVTTMATTGRLIGDGGDLTAACRMGSQVVAYKARSMFLGSFVGAPVVWQWDKVPGDVGCVGQRAVCDIGGPQFFVGEDHLYIFDGTRPLPVGVGVVRQWFFASLDSLYRDRTICVWDPTEGRVWILFVSTSSPDHKIDTALVYHLVRQSWGVAKIGIEAALQFFQSGTTMDGAPGTFGDAPVVSYDSALWASDSRQLALIDTTHTLTIASGPGLDSGMTTGDIGDDDVATMVRSLRLRYSVTPTSATVRGYTRAVASDSLTLVGASGPLADGKLDCRQSGRWHRFAISFVGDVEFNALKVDVSRAGMR